MTLRFAIRNLLRHRRRSLLVLFNVAFGVGGLFAFHGFNAGIMNDYRTKVIRQQMGNGQLSKKGYRDAVLEKPQEEWLTNSEILTKKIKTLPYVEDLYPRVRFPALISAAGGESSLSAYGEGVDAQREAKFFNALKLKSGKILTSEANGILLAKGLAESLKVKVGDKVTVLSQTVSGAINGVDAVVTGVFFTGEANFDRSFFRIPLALAQNLLDTQKVELLAVGLKDFSKWKEFQTWVATEFPDLEAYSFEQIDKVNYENSVVWLDSQFQLILFIFLTIIVLGVFNTTSLGVIERTREVGICLSNGETLKSVRRSFLVESLCLGTLGAIAGVLAMFVIDATVLAKGILMPPPPGFEGYYYAFLKLDPQAAVRWIALGVGCTAAASWFALRRLNQKSIVEMLAHV